MAFPVWWFCPLGCGGRWQPEGCPTPAGTQSRAGPVSTPACRPTLPNWEEIAEEQWAVLRGPQGLAPPQRGAQVLRRGGRELLPCGVLLPRPRPQPPFPVQPPFQLTGHTAACHGARTFPICRLLVPFFRRPLEAAPARPRHPRLPTHRPTHPLCLCLCPSLCPPRSQQQSLLSFTSQQARYQGNVT